MKKLVVFFIILSMLILATGCSLNSHSRNSDYSYGTYDESIETIYELTNVISQYHVTDYSSGLSKGQSGSCFVCVSETACGGVVAFSEGVYVYSPNKSDADSVSSELIKEIVSSKQDK